MEDEARQRRAGARDQGAAERQKKGIFTGKELCEAADMSHGADEGSADDDVEFKELLRLKKQAAEEEEKRVAAEAAAALEKAKASGVHVRRGGARVGHLHRRAEREQTKGDDESDYTDSEEEVEEAGDDGKPKAVIKRIRRRKEEKEDDEEDDEGGGGGGRHRKRRGRRSSPRALRRRRCSSRRRRTPTRWRRSLLAEDEVDESQLDPKELGRRLAEKKAKEEAEAAALIEKVQKEKEEKEARKAAKKAENEAKRAAKKAEKEKGKKKKGEDDITTLEEAMKGVSVAAAEKQASASGAISKSALKRTVTGVLASRPTSRDIKITNFSMGMNGRELVKDCDIEITIGADTVSSGRTAAARPISWSASPSARCPSRITSTSITQERRQSPRTAPRFRR